MDAHWCIMFFLSIAQNNVFVHFKEILAPYGITPGQFSVLSFLWIYDRLTPKQIREMAHLEASSVSGVLDRMQKAGLIVRNTDPNNRRTIWVSATEKGKKLEKLVQQVVNNFDQEILEPFTLPEKEFLFRALKTIASEEYSTLPLPEDSVATP